MLPWAHNDTMDATKMAAIVKQATKVKNMVVEKALSQAEDPAVVKARELAADARLKEEALERRIRELAHSRFARIPLSGAAINDDLARLLAKELTKMTAALPKVEAGAGTGDGACDGSGAGILKQQLTHLDMAVIHRQWAERNQQQSRSCWQ